MKYYFIRFIGSDGNILGYRADSVGTISKNWGKVYSGYGTVVGILSSAYKSGHQELGSAISKLNPVAGEILKNQAHNEKKIFMSQIMCAEAFEGFNENSYTNADFEKLTKNSFVVNQVIH